MEWPRWVRACWTHFRAMVLSRRSERELRDELAFHLAMQEHANRQCGMSEADAIRQARFSIGGIEQVTERCRDVRPLRWARDFVADLRYAARSLRHSPAFALAGIVTLALATAASTTVYSAVAAILLEPLPYPEADRLVRIWSTGQGHPLARYESALPDYHAWRTRTRSFEDLGAYFTSDRTLTGSARPEVLRAAHLTASLWTILRAQPRAGTLFTEAAEQWGVHRVMVVSDGLWRRRFASDASVIGRQIELDGESYTLVGVMPPPFEFPNAEIEMWVPLSFPPAHPNNTRRSRFVDVLARLEPGVTLAQAEADLVAVAAGLAQEEPASNTGLGATLEGWHQSIVRPVRPTLWILSGAVAFVLLIGCANVASLCLARANARQHELIVRATLGADRGRLVRQLFAESLLVSATATVGALILTVALIHLLSTIGPSTIPRVREVEMDGGVLGVAIALAVITPLVFGLWPARQAGHRGSIGRLREASRTVIGGSRHTRARQWLIASEVAISLVLLIGAVLLMVSLGRIHQVDPGFAPEYLFTARVSVPVSKYAPAARATFMHQLTDGVRSLPGIRAAGITTALPLAGSDWTKYLWVDGWPIPRAVTEVPLVSYRQVTPEYLQTMAVSVVAGRLFTARDRRDSPLVAIVNEALARRFWPDGGPIGARISLNPPEALLPPQSFPMPNGARSFPRLTLVGVVADVRQNGLDREPSAEVFVPLAQAAGALPETTATGFLVARTAGDPLASMAAIQDVLGQLDRDIALSSVRTMDDRLSQSLAERRFLLFLMAAFAAVAATLALGGLYGVMSYISSQRRHEIGVRVALGATTADAMRLVMREGWRLMAIGIALGLVVAGALTQFMSAQLFQVRALDPGTYIGVSVALAIAGALACGLPALRASRVDPTITLRYD